MKESANNAINTDGLGQRASGASPKPAGYGGRWAYRESETYMLRRQLLILIAGLPLVACNSAKSPDSSSSSQSRQQSNAVPQDFRHLLPLAQRWGIGDDSQRSRLTDKATPAEKQELQAAVGPHRQQINAWLDSYQKSPMPDEAAAFMYLLLAMEEMSI